MAAGSLRRRTPSGFVEFICLGNVTMPSSRRNLKGKEMESEDSLTVSQNSKNIALITWVGTVFFWFVPGQISYLTQKDDPYIQDQAKEAMNWSITALCGYLAGLILVFIFLISAFSLTGVLVLVAVAICHLVVCIMGVLGTSNGKKFRVPFAIRLIK